MLQHSRCFKESNISAAAVLIALGLGSNPSPKFPWWEVFEISWKDLLFVTSLVATDLFKFKKTRIDFSQLSKSDHIISSKMLWEYSLDALWIYNQNKSESDIIKPINPAHLYRSSSFKKRDNRFIPYEDEVEEDLGLDFDPTPKANQKNQETSDQKEISHSSQDDFSLNEVNLSEFAPKRVSKRSLLSRNEQIFERGDTDSERKSGTPALFSSKKILKSALSCSNIGVKQVQSEKHKI